MAPCQNQRKAHAAIHKKVFGIRYSVEISVDIRDGSAGEVSWVFISVQRWDESCATILWHLAASGDWVNSSDCIKNRW